MSRSFLACSLSVVSVSRILAILVAFSCLGLELTFNTILDVSALEKYENSHFPVLKIILFDQKLSDPSRRVTREELIWCVFKCFGIVKSQCATSAVQRGDISHLMQERIFLFYVFGSVIRVSVSTYLGSSDSLGISRWSATYFQSCIAWPRLENLEWICFYPRH